MPTGIELDGFDEFAAALDRAPELGAPIFERAMNAALDAVGGYVKPYPPETESNRPGRWRQVRQGDHVTLRPEGYYERHKGYWYPVMLKKTLGEKPKKSTGAMGAGTARRRYKMAGAGGVAGYKLGKRSEFLGQKWTRTTRLWRDAGFVSGIVGVIGNIASYALPVNGPRDGAAGKRQSRLMREIGWTPMDVALESAEPAVRAAFQSATKELLEAFGKR